MKLKKIVGLSLMLTGAWVAGNAQYDGDPTLMGYQYNAANNLYDIGMYRIPTAGNGTELLWKDSYSYQDNNSLGREMVAGWLRNGHLYGFIEYYPSPVQTYYKYVQRDLKTGTVSKETDINLSSGWENYFISATYCPVNDRIYGYGFNASRTAFAFKSAPASNPSQAIIIKEVGNSYPGSLCFNHETGCLVGVSNVRNSSTDTYTNTLVNIDVNTGQTTDIFTITTSYISDYKCSGGLIWVPARQAYLWNFYSLGQIEDEACSLLMELNPVTKYANVLRNFEADKNFMYFVAENNEPKAAADAPQTVKDIQTKIDGSKLELSFNLPSNLINGNAISGNVDYTIYIDNKSVSVAKGAAGASINYTATLSDGTHFIRVVPSVNGKKGLGEIYAEFVGSSIPETPENIVLTETELTWEPVFQGIMGNTLKDVKYEVYVNDKKVGETSDTKMSMAGIISSDNELTSYQAVVQTTSEGKTSKKGYSNHIIAGKPWTVPFTVTPTMNQYELMEQDDVDGDNTGWSIDYDSTNGNQALTSGFSRYDASDDWIFMPKFTADADKVYSFSFNVYLADTSLPGGAVEVWVGDGPTKNDMKKVIIPSIVLSQDNRWNEYSGEFVCNGDLAGKDLYIGVGVKSDKNILSPIRIYDIKVAESKTASINGPEAVSDLSLTRDEKDAKIACLTFTMPSKTLTGSVIPANATVSVKMSVEGGASETVTGKPGETVTGRLNVGTNNCLVAVTPSYNGITGLSANCVSSLNFGLPGKVRNLRASYDRDNIALRLDWDAPLTDVNGKPVEGDQFSYQIWTKDPESGDFELAINVDYPLSFATVSMDAITYLYNLEVAVTASNSLGTSPEIALILCQVGEPYSLPIDDDFNGDSFKNEPMTLYVGDIYKNARIAWGNPQNELLGLTDDMIAVDGDVLCGIPSEVGSISRVDLPKVSTIGHKNVTLSLNIWTGADAAKTTIRGTYPGSDDFEWDGITYYPETAATIATVPKGNGYQLVNINYPEEFINQPWISTIIESEYPTLGSRFVLAGFTLSGTNSVNNVTETLYGTIIGTEGMIKVTGYDGETVYVYGLDGTLVNSDKVVGNLCDIAVDRGLYIVKVANRCAKVVVK